MKYVALTLVSSARASSPLIGIYQSDPDPSYLEMYQDWVGQFGAHSVILPLEGDAEPWIRNLSALLIPGGDGDVPPFARSLIQHAIKANSGGAFFPLWGTCAGFEWIIQTVGGLSALQQGFDATDLSLSLNFTGASPGKLFGAANASIMTWLATENITYNWHINGTTPTHFKENYPLSKSFEVLATSRDRKGQPFVAAIEHLKWPIYGVQFHPEKVRYCHNKKKHIPRTPRAVAVSDYLANFFVSQASKIKDIHGEAILV